MGIPRIHKEVSVFDPDNTIGDGIAKASSKAESYITDITGGGIMVHPSGDSTSGWRISSAIELLKSGVTYIKAWLAGPNDDVPTVQIGASDNGNYALIDDDSFDIYHGDTQMVHFGYGEGNASTGLFDAPYYTLGKRTTTTAEYDASSTYAVGAHVLHNNVEYVCVEAIGSPEAWTWSHWQSAFGNFSVAEGSSNTASGYSSHAEGNFTTAIGKGSHAEGNNTYAIGPYSHAEGFGTTARGEKAHAEGDSSSAGGPYSHAEGFRSVASGYNSHAQNRGTKALCRSQTAIGEYNVPDNSGGQVYPGTYAAIIGNGTADDARSNALAVRWSGIVDEGTSAVPGSIVPVGTIIDYAGQSIPSGYLECDGSAVSRTAYPLLFAAIGTAWGAGDGSTTFNLPNLGGRACIGKGSRSVGNTGGSETHTLTTTELPSHAHGLNGHTHGMAHVHSTNIGHGHGFTQPKIPNHAHSATGTNRFLVYNYGTVQAGVSERKVAAASSGNYTAPVVNHADTDWGGAANTGDPTSNPACTGGAVTDYSGSKTSGGALKSASDTSARNSTDGCSTNTANAGDGNAHSIMQPYAVVRKIIRAA